MKTPILVVLLLQFSLSIYGQSFDDNTNQTLKNYISVFPDQTQFSVAMINGDEVNFYGQLKLSDTINTIDNSTSIFQIGSVTKVFTSTLLAQLILEKQLKLTDSLQNFFEFPLNEKGITLERLSNHTSGLPRLPSNINLTAVDLRNPYQSYTEADLFYYLESEMEISQGSQPMYQYSNIGASVLAKALENATDKSFSLLLTEQIFQPLGMLQSSLEEQVPYSQLVQGLDANGKPTPPWDMNQFEGAGEILSTTQDLSAFLKAHFPDLENAYSLTTLPTFMVNDNLRIGLGWHILKAEDGNDLYWHNGATTGYSSSVFMIPETKKAVVILTNVSAFHPKASTIDELGFKLLNLF
jgi:CubicO group peptidase (beta-lactamase class C family)